MSSRRSVLLVDDNLDLCLNLADILEDKGYRVRIAFDGEEALRAVSEEAFDIVLLDVKMPTMNGVEAFRKIRAVRPSATVIMMTAFTTDDLVSEAVKAGVSTVLYKPLEINDLLALIARSTGDDSAFHRGQDAGRQ